MYTGGLVMKENMSFYHYVIEYRFLSKMEQ